MQGVLASLHSDAIAPSDDHSQCATVIGAHLRIGSRGSQLALWQANHISELLRAHGHKVEIEIIHTTGDKITDVALAMVGTKGGLAKECSPKKSKKPSPPAASTSPSTA